nr:MAG TPA: hypothetical protein [Bacteriophage sp.]
MSVLSARFMLLCKQRELVNNQFSFFVHEGWCCKWQKSAPNRNYSLTSI